MSDDLRAPLVFDASVTINFLGSGVAGQLLGLLGRPVYMAERAFGEIRRHPLQGRDHVEELRAAMHAGHLEIKPLDNDARELFFELTSADIPGGLDDGEAATIALAISLDGKATPVLDDHKARILLGKRWPDRSVAYTIDLLIKGGIADGLPRESLAAAVHSALRYARMRVPLAERASICDLIGHDRARECSSLGLIAQRA